MKSSIKNKKILFIAPLFYDYHTIIKQRLEEYGAEVYFAPERDYSLVFSIVNNFFSSKMADFQLKYYLKILKNTEEIEFDYLFIIKGYGMPLEFPTLFKRRYPNAELIMHQWDSTSNNSFLHLIPSFDKVFSFDIKDVKTHPELQYLPNFYLDDITERKKEVRTPKYDILFVASFLPERYECAMQLLDFAKKNTLNVKVLLVIPFQTYLKKRIRGQTLNRSLLSFTPLSRTEYLDLFIESKVIYDMGSNSQTGLSQRTIETIEAGKKLLTNNQYIKEEKIYNQHQVCITEGNFSTDVLNFMNNEFSAVPTEYSLDNWVVKIFG